MGEDHRKEGEKINRVAAPPAADRSGAAPPVAEAARLRDLSPQQWKSGIAAWLGWLFDGLDMHLYVLVATPFVAELLEVAEKDRLVGYYSSWIQAAFLFGWALGGGFFGRIGDRLGRSRALMLTILTYALFTGLSFFARTWWQLLIFRFLAALGIGGEWAVGASLLSETSPTTAPQIKDGLTIRYWASTWHRRRRAFPQPEPFHGNSDDPCYRPRCGSRQSRSDPIIGDLFVWP